MKAGAYASVVGLCCVAGGSAAIHFAIPTPDELYYMNMKDGHYNDVLPYYEQRFEKRPIDWEAASSLLHIYQNLGEPHRAQGLLLTLAERYQADGIVQTRLRTGYDRARMDASLAALVVEHASHEAIDDDSALIASLRYFERTGDLPQLRRLLRGRVLSSSATTEEIIQYCRLLTAAGEHQAAIDLWADLLRQDRLEHPLDAFKALYTLSAAQGRSDEVIPLVQAASANAAAKADVVQFAYWLLAQGDVAHFNALLADDEQADPRRLRLLAQADMRAGRKAEARDKLLVLLAGAQLNRDDAALLLELLLDESGTHTGAISALLATYFPADAMADADPYRQHLYASALSALGRHAQVADYWTAQLAAASDPADQRRAIDALMAQGRYDVVLPKLAQLAIARGEPFMALLNEASARSDRRDMFVEALRQRAQRRDTTDAERRILAALLLESGDRHTAQTLLMALAADTAPDHPDAHTLLYLWGPRPDAPAMEWLAQRLSGDDPSRRAAWARTLLERGGAAYVAQRFQRNTGGLSVEERDLLAQALVSLGQWQDLRSILEEALQGDVPASALKRYAAWAQQAGATGLAFRVWHRAWEVSGDPQAARHLGMAAYSDARWHDAANLLGEYRRAGDADPEALFFYGEALRKLGREEQAGAAYRQAAAALSEMAPLELQLALLHATVRSRLEPGCGGVRGFGDLYARYPQSAQVLEAYAQALIECGQPASAGHLLSRDNTKR